MDLISYLAFRGFVLVLMGLLIKWLWTDPDHIKQRRLENRRYMQSQRGLRLFNVTFDE